ncbi:MAG: serine/threonine protein kinase [Betaproteobacteria bacterium]|nr:MAG: serine/threonine protein kinase [Betaproteobacteria bacterium]
MLEPPASRPTLTTAQWKRVFAALETSGQDTSAKDDPDVARAVAYLRATQQSEATKLKSFANMADALLINAKLTAGQRCGNYALIEPIARGGMGSVWHARREDGLYQSEVAVKLLGSLALSAQARARFAREGELLARLTHPHIARLLDAGLTDDSQRFLVIELVQGVDIATFCRTLSERDRIVLFRQLLGAVSYAHSQLVLHRDIKPGNVLVDANGQVKLLDFGVAKLFESTQPDAETTSAEADLTRVVGAAYTESYAAPEQVRGETIGTQADVFALGTLLFELVLGERLTWNLPKREWRAQNASVRLTNVTRQLHPDLLAVLTKATANEAVERYQTAVEFDADLARYLAAEPVKARATGRWYRTMKFVQRHRLAIGGASFAATAVIASLAFALVQLAESREQQRLATIEANKAAEISKFTTSLFSVLDPKVSSAVDRSKLTAKQILDIGRERIRTELHDQPETRLALLGTLAEMYGRLEQTDEFLALNEERRQTAERLFGQHHPTVYDAMQTDLWADVYSGNFATARTTLEKLDAGAGARGERGEPGDERAAVRLHAWAEIVRRGGLEIGAPVLARYERSLAAFERAKSRSPDFAAALGNYANAHAELSDFAASLPLYDRALEMIEQARRNPAMTIDVGDVFMLLRARARARQALKQYAEAERDFRRGIELATSSSGADHILTKQVRAELALLLHSTNRRDEAWREMRAVDETAAPPSANPSGMNHIDLLRARMLAAESKFDAAAILVSRAIASWRLAGTQPTRLREAENLLAEINAQRAAGHQSPKR